MRRWETLFVALVFVGLAWYGAYRAQFGFIHTDEGYYLGCPMRYHLGDTPFVDEWGTTVAMFDLVLWPVFTLFPDVGLYEFRLLGVALELSYLAVLVLFFRRYTAVGLLAIASIAVAFSGFKIMTPAYNKLGQTFFFLSISLWLTGCRPWRTMLASRLLGIGAAFAFFVGSLAYTPLVATLAVPGIVWLGTATTERKNARIRTATQWFLFVAVGLWSSFFATLFIAGIADDYVRNVVHHFRLLFAGPSETFLSTSTSGRFARLLRVGLPAAGFATMVCIAVFVLHAVLPRRGGSLRTIFGAALCLAVASGCFYAIQYTPVPEFWAFDTIRRFWVFMTATGLLLFAAAKGVWRQWLGTGSGAGAIWNFECVAFLAITCCYFVELGFFSTNGFFNTMFAVPGFMFLGVACADVRWSLAAEISPSPVLQHRWFQGALACVLLILGVLQLRQHNQSTYGDRPPHALTASFSSWPLQRIRSTPDQVATIEGIIDRLRPNMIEGEHLLVFDDFPMLYFILRARPALPRTWPSLFGGWPLSERKRMLKYINEHTQHIPRFCVRHDGYNVDINTHASDPVHEYVRKHFRLIATFPPPSTAASEFEIWERIDQNEVPCDDPPIDVSSNSTRNKTGPQNLR